MPVTRNRYLTRQQITAQTETYRDSTLSSGQTTTGWGQRQRARNSALYGFGGPGTRQTPKPYPSPDGNRVVSMVRWYSPPPLPSGRVGSVSWPSFCTFPSRSTSENLSITEEGTGGDGGRGTTVPTKPRARLDGRDTACIIMQAKYPSQASHVHHGIRASGDHGREGRLAAGHHRCRGDDGDGAHLVTSTAATTTTSIIKAIKATLRSSPSRRECRHVIVFTALLPTAHTTATSTPTPSNHYPHLHPTSPLASETRETKASHNTTCYRFLCAHTRTHTRTHTYANVGTHAHVRTRRHT